MVAVIAALEKIGVQTGGFFAMIGAAGLAALALKDSVAGVAAGWPLSFCAPSMSVAR